MDYHAGRHFLQIPGPTNVPDRVLRAMDRPTIDHRGPEFAQLAIAVLEGLKSIFATRSQVIIFPSSGTGAWEAALVNTLSPGDKVLMVETGQFAHLWHAMALKLGLAVELIPGDWRSGVDPESIGVRLGEDRAHSIKAVAIVHNETSTGVTSAIAPIRTAIDRTRHPALLLVDTISSLGSIEYRHDDWGVDVSVAGSQKGLMLPPGLGFNAISSKALAASAGSRMPKAYWSWQDMLAPNAAGFFPYTPATNMLMGLREALAMLHEEGLPNVYARHARHARATRAAVKAWGLELLCRNTHEYSNALTAVMLPAGFDADALRRTILDRFNMSLGQGLGKLKGSVFRIGHLGDFNDLTLMGTLAGVQMGLHLQSVPTRADGLAAAMDALLAPALEPQLATP